MKKIHALRYVDAFYTDDSSALACSTIVFPVHVAVGSAMLSSNDEVVFSYAKEEGKPEKGLRIPLGALILTDNEEKRQMLHLKKGHKIGVHWKDIVYFENGNVPAECSTMYTEGKVFHVASNALVVANPETLRTVSGRVGNHPEKKPAYYVIPFSFIQNIEYHEK